MITKIGIMLRFLPAGSAVGVMVSLEGSSDESSIVPLLVDSGVVTSSKMKDTSFQKV